MDLSFVIYFHSSRLDNLQQMLRLLSRRENISQYEIVLVCQDRCGWIPEGFKGVRSLSLGLPMYQKPILCNRGVEASTGRIIALLDSDRVLPAGWFSKAASEVRRGEILTTWNLSWCPRPYTDDEIDAGRIELIPDIKCTANSLLRKNAFSGNTVMHREDYLAVGGMDESFVGYGFADSDMVENCRSKGLRFLFREEPEIHLYHDKYIMIGSSRMIRSDYRAYTLLNGLRFCSKWKKPPDAPLLNLLRAVRSTGGSPLMPQIEACIKKLRILT